MRDLLAAIAEYNRAVSVSDALAQLGINNTAEAEAVVSCLGEVRRAVRAELALDGQDESLVDGATLMALHMANHWCWLTVKVPHAG